jgi:hypothetical protein
MVMRERLIVAGGNEHSAFSIQHSAFSHEWTLQVPQKPFGTGVLAEG